MIEEAVPTGTIHGHVSAGFEPVLAAFRENFASRGEVGAACALYHHGELVVDLYGGSADPRADQPWTDETITTVFSCTKGAMALLVHYLAERGVIDLDAPVTELWPDYGAQGKGGTTVRMMLDHTAGVPALREPVKEHGFLEWDYITGRIAAEAPFFQPGTRSSYHGLTFAWTVGEMIRRAAGRTAGDLFAELFAVPLGLDFWIGLPEEHEPRVARLLKAKFVPGEPETAFIKALADKSSIPSLFFSNDGGYRASGRDYRAAEIGSANGVTNARSLARLYGPVSTGGRWQGTQYFSARTIEAMGRVSNASHYDATLCLPMRFGPGFMKSVDNRRVIGPPAASIILSDAAFGHGGAGGSLGFADPDAGLAFGYVMNQMGQGQLLNDRGQSLVDAAYRAIGYGGNESGVWAR